DRFAYTLQWEAASLLTVFLGVYFVASKRFASPAINPLDKTAKSFIEVPQRFLKNTVEQFVMHFVACLILTTHLAEEQMVAIPALVLLFVTGRLCFGLGYSYGYIYRAFGFALTILPTASVVLYCVYRLVSGVLLE
ncbi:predicted protein, partial [Nematostella vectensis]